MIKSEGDPTAGSSYTLVCQVTVTQGLVVDPDVVWLDSSGMTVSGLMGRPSIEGNVVTRNLTFNPLHTTHGGVYTCHASISLPSISIANLSNNSSAIITVLSMLICYLIRFSLRVLIIVFLTHSSTANCLHHTQPHWCSVCWHSPHPHLLHSTEPSSEHHCDGEQDVEGTRITSSQQQ